MKQKEGTIVRPSMILAGTSNGTEEPFLYANTYRHVLDEMKAASAERLDGIIDSVLPAANAVSITSTIVNNPLIEN